MNESYYKPGYSVIKTMVGENVEMLKMAAESELIVGFTLSYNRPTFYGRVVMFNEFTGRVFIRKGDNLNGYVENFQMKEVKAFRIPNALWDEWIRKKGAKLTR